MYMIFKYILSLVFKLVGLNTYSGSRYPNVPAGRVDTWESLSLAKALDSPKSAILACMCSFNKMLDGFKSLWIIGGLQPLCRYSSPATPPENNCKLIQVKKNKIKNKKSKNIEGE